MSLLRTVPATAGDDARGSIVQRLRGHIASPASWGHSAPPAGYPTADVHAAAAGASVQAAQQLQRTTKQPGAFNPRPR